MLNLALNYSLLGLLYFLSALPLVVAHWIGDCLGVIASKLPIERSRVVRININLCFPELSEVGRKKLALKHWKLLCRSFVERGYFWLGNKDKIKQLVQIESEVDLTDKKPRLYVGMHMVGIEAGLIGLSLHLQELGVIQPITLYIQMKNHFFDTRIKFWRERFGSQMMLRQENIRNFIRAIKNGQFLLLSPDMDLGLKDSIFVPFFKIPTCTVTSISRLAFLSQAEVCAVVTTLNPDGKSYTCKISRPWESFPSKDEVVDTLKLNQFFESQIQPRPAEYYWVHKRFKNRPDGQPRFY